MAIIGIIGAGFSGLMTAIHLLKKNSTLKIFLFDPSSIGKGIAYNPQSDHVLLNVVTGKMSAFSDQPNHFLNWCQNKKEYINYSETLLAQSFMPRSVYGEYLQDLYNTQLKTNNRFIHETERIENIEVKGDKIFLKTESNEFCVDKAVLATGNTLPSNHVVPKGLIDEIYYHQNPWRIEFSKINKNQPIVIVGNGLSMVDTVIELRKRKFDQHIYSVSPNGFNILPHRQFNYYYDGPLTNHPTQYSLHQLLGLFTSELKKLKNFGISAEPLVDALRPHTQSIWKKLNPEEKQIFMKKIRHLWGQARHRLPFSSYDFIQNEQILDRLSIIAGKLTGFESNSNGLIVNIFDKKKQKTLDVLCTGVINCTGPETNYSKIEGNLIGSLISKGLAFQDEIKLGIEVDNKFQVLDKNLKTHHIYAIGSLLKGKLWESTAVNELRVQAETIAQIIAEDIAEEQNH